MYWVRQEVDHYSIALLINRLHSEHAKLTKIDRMVCWRNTKLTPDKQEIKIGLLQIETMQVNLGNEEHLP